MPPLRRRCEQTDEFGRRHLEILVNTTAAKLNLEYRPRRVVTNRSYVGGGDLFPLQRHSYPAWREVSTPRKIMQSVTSCSFLPSRSLGVGLRSLPNFSGFAQDWWCSRHGRRPFSERMAKLINHSRPACDLHQREACRPLARDHRIRLLPGDERSCAGLWMGDLQRSRRSAS